MPPLPKGRRRATTATALLLAGSSIFGTLSTSAVAHADDVSTAQARVDRLQGLVLSTTKTLTEGTKKWEHDRAALRTVNLQLAGTRSRIAAAQGIADAQTARLSGLARQLYMSPAPGQIQLAFTKGPADFTDSLQSLGALNVAAVTGSAIVRRATTARVQLQGEERTAKQLESAALALEQQSAKRLAQLEALAQSTSLKLVDAQNALQHARADAAARAAAARAARERASRIIRVTASAGPVCTGRPVQGQQNGFLDPASLCPLWMGGGATLKGTAAAAFNRMSKYHAATVGSPLCVTGGYRTYQRQVELYREKPGLAAVPGTSEHGWGNAVDLCGGVQQTGSAAYNWMQRNSRSFGWFHPSWAEPSGSNPEPWHWEFSG